MIVTDIDYLHKPCEWVKPDDPIADIVAALFKEMAEQNTWGLAANQLRVRLRIFVMTMDPKPPICIVNPILAKQKGRDMAEEICESLPGITRMVTRPKEVVIKGVNQYFRLVTWRLRGLRARVACHEMDHLCGKLIIDEGNMELALMRKRIKEML